METQNTINESSKTFISTKAKATMTLNKKLYNKKILVKISSLEKPLKNKIVKFYVKGKYIGKTKPTTKE